MSKPKIRVKGYKDDWEQRKLGDVFEQTTNFVNLDEDKMELWSLTVEDGLTPKSERYNREFLVKKDTNFKEVRPGDIVYNPMNMTLGAVGYNGMAKSVAVSGYYTTMVANAGYDSYYINTWLKSPYAISLYKTFATGSLKEKQRVQFPTLSIIPTVFPKTEEQKKIGQFFENLDRLITLHQRKCDETKKLKKYMLQKMFPQNGNKVPEIRFFGFTDDWEQRKFNEFVKNVAKKNKDNLDLEPFAVTNDRGFIAQKDAHEDFGYMKDTDRRAYNIVPPNSFAYNPARINVGSLGYYAGTENVIVSSLYEVFQTEDFIDDRFLWHWLKSEHFPKWIEKLQEGSVRLYFYFDKLIQCQMMIPSVEEQKIISEYLDRIDTLITLHHRKYEELQKIKKFMLQNMFV